GYGAKADNYPFEVTSCTLATQCGDEPAMLFDALQEQVPIVIAPERVQAVKYIEKNIPDTDIIMSDDGLQHYKLARDK
ncbi:tetraacyldisaccharide 4'-kinase, partial [Francisella tularensis subsp. holarctica]|uniref:tetraacyldisaccharide 4'-kinase n=1 Tax=Francisella tularensis TaxID=263 RepID=UPI002381A4F6